MLLVSGSSLHKTSPKVSILFQRFVNRLTLSRYNMHREAMINTRKYIANHSLRYVVRIRYKYHLCYKKHHGSVRLSAAKVTTRSAGGRSLAVTCYWRHNLRRSSLHWTKRWTGLNLTLRVNDRYPKFLYFVKRPYWWISALGLKWMVWKFETNCDYFEEVIAEKTGPHGVWNP